MPQGSAPQRPLTAFAVLGLLGENSGSARGLLIVGAAAATVLILLYRPRRTVPEEGPVKREHTTRKNGHGDEPHHARAVLRDVTVDVPTRYADDIAEACRAAGWTVRDSGLTVSTDDDEHALTTLLVDIPLAPRAPAGSPDAHGERSLDLPLLDARIPYLYHAIYSNRDLFVGDEAAVDSHLSAEGKIVIGAGARVKGRIRAHGDVVVRDGAVVGHVVSEGTVRLEGSAVVTDSVEARGGLVRDVTQVNGVATGTRALRAPETNGN